MTSKGSLSPQITVEHIINLALPSETQVVAGEMGLGREVTWAVLQRPMLPSFPSLKGGEVALVSIEALQNMHYGTTLQQLIRQLADKNVAAIATTGEAAPEAQDLANKLSLPVLVLPPETNMREVENLISRTITEHRTEVYKWEMELHRRFTHLSLEGEGIQVIGEALADITGQIALIEDESLNPQFVSANAASLGLTMPLPPDQALRTWLRSLGNNGVVGQQTRMFSIAATGLSRVVVPITARKQIIGYMSLVGETSTLSELSRRALTVAASACSLEMSKTLVMTEAENRFKGELIDRLVEGAIHSLDQIASRGKSIGFDSRRAYLVAVAKLDPPSTGHNTNTFAEPFDSAREEQFAKAFQQQLSALGSGFVIRNREDCVIVLCPLEKRENENKKEENSNGAVMTTVRILESARQQAMELLNDSTASLGIGRYYPGLSGLATSYLEARQALGIAQTLLEGKRSAYFGDLGPYRLLFLLKDAQELRDFYQETLGQLLDYDQKKNSELVSTLENFFANHGNTEKVAESLCLHRNTLAYRLRRIEQLTGFDLKNSEHSFCLQLALKARNIVR